MKEGVDSGGFSSISISSVSAKGLAKIVVVTENYSRAVVVAELIADVDRQVDEVRCQAEVDAERLVATGSLTHYSNTSDLGTTVDA